MIFFSKFMLPSFFLTVPREASLTLGYHTGTQLQSSLLSSCGLYVCWALDLHICRVHTATELHWANPSLYRPFLVSPGLGRMCSKYVRAPGSNTMQKGRHRGYCLINFKPHPYFLQIKMTLVASATTHLILLFISLMTQDNASTLLLSTSASSKQPLFQGL